METSGIHASSKDVSCKEIKSETSDTYNTSKEPLEEGPKEPPILVAVMGQTGTGKSSFINRAAGSSLKEGHDLNSCTQNIQTAEVTLGGRRVIIIDSPGFDDITRTDVDILHIIGLHLQQGSKEKLLLTGIIYILKITDNRMLGTGLNNLRLLKKLCGDAHFEHIALVTSHWDIVTPEVGERRQKQLSETDEWWGDMIRKGATAYRHENTAESAIKILSKFLPKPTFVPEFEKEFIAAHGNVAKTAVGKEILQIFRERLGQFEQEISRLRKEKNDMEKQIKNLEGQINRLNEREREIGKSLSEKEDFIVKQSDARERLEGQIEQLKAAICELEQKTKKDNSLEDQLSSKLKLIDETRSTKEKAENDMQGVKKKVEGVQQGEQTQDATEKVLSTREDVAANTERARDTSDGEIQTLMAEIARLTEEVGKQAEMRKDLELKGQLLKEAETSKKNAEGEIKSLRKEVENLENSRKDILSSNLNLIRGKEEMNEKIEDLATKVRGREENQAKVRNLETEVGTSLNQPATEKMFQRQDKPHARTWSRLSICAVQ